MTAAHRVWSAATALVLGLGCANGIPDPDAGASSRRLDGVLRIPRLRREWASTPRGYRHARGRNRLHVGRATLYKCRDLLTEGVEAGEIWVDVPADELASYCLHAITAASSLPTKAAVRRLVAVILRGLHPRG